ncbi:MAG: patatin-like phospholipase family protein [Deltaproteobacteria bacterium]|nr:patatin-like phospholipase family protein [Deltaproteobacteria bacterium]
MSLSSSTAGDIFTVRAGAEALATLRREGFSADSFSTLLGASGGPKWLVLAWIDRVLARRLVGERTTPLHALGTSIGAFRHAALAQADAPSAIERFAQAYVAQAYHRQPTPAEVTEESRRILDVLFGADGVAQALAHATLRLHVGTARSRGLAAAHRPGALAAGLALAAAANAVSRRLLRIGFERVVFHTTRQPVFSFDDLPTRHAMLGAGNFVQATLASGSIPLVMEAIRDVAGGPPGLYRDGGITDYHFAMDFDAPPGLVFYPHFCDRIVPGWFDKALTWRRPRGGLLDRTVFVAPSQRFIATLPGGKIPDRSDFKTLSTADRQQRWNEVLAKARRLGEALEELLEGTRLADVALPFAK